MNREVTLILPAYNEAAAISVTIASAVRYFRARSLSYEIVVAADGDDGTREKALESAAADPDIRVIGGPRRAGKGRGVREAVALARGRIVGFADADGKVPIEEFDKFEPLLARGAPVVIGSRAIRDEALVRSRPFHRRVGSRAFGVLVRSVIGLRELTDTQCGFKFFQLGVARELFGVQRIDGYMFDVEILALAARLGHQIYQVPVSCRDDGDSRLQLITGNVRNFRDILAIRRSLRRLPQPRPSERAAAVGNG